MWLIHTESLSDNMTIWKRKSWIWNLKETRSKVCHENGLGGLGVVWVVFGWFGLSLPQNHMNLTHYLTAAGKNDSILWKESETFFFSEKLKEAKIPQGSITKDCKWIPMLPYNNTFSLGDTPFGPNTLYYCTFTIKIIRLSISWTNKCYIVFPNHLFRHSII